ncbi:hypothetical protein ABN702_12605 [Bacillus haimaensis]|uniref:hypothetical protein n=1 Tax=Bacillus haimaensis TaxID=3160967 RepID=UPI003AA94DF2
MTNLTKHHSQNSHTPKKIDIFYKTYPEDEEWLDYSIKSVYKYSSNFRQIVIVSNRGHNYRPPAGNIPVKYIEIDLPPDNPGYPHGVGYWWQMATKLTWHLYTDADAIVSVDSDQIFFDYFSPASWHKDDKIIWLRRPWSESGRGIIWKQGADYLLGKPTQYDYMVSSGFYISRSAIKLFNQYLLDKFSQTPTQYYMDLKHPRTSEYVPIGAFIDMINHKDYKFYNYKELNGKPWPLKQFRSWDKISKETREKLEEIIK